MILRTFYGRKSNLSSDYSVSPSFALSSHNFGPLEFPSRSYPASPLSPCFNQSPLKQNSNISKLACVKPDLQLINSKRGIFVPKSFNMTFIVAGLDFTCLLDSLSKLELPTRDCFLNLFAKALGYAIILASTIVKVPQIVLILRKRSIQGLSIASFEMELVGYTIALSYCYFKRLPFSTYGELAFLLAQALVLVVLLYRFSSKSGFMVWVKVGIYSAMAPIFFAGKLDPALFEMLYVGQTGLFLVSRIPQIWKIYLERSSGNLSFTTCAMNFLGCIARLFTSLQAKAPMSMVVGSLLGMLMHGIIFSQIVFYKIVAKKVKLVKEN